MTRYASRIPGIGIVAVKKQKFAIPQGATHDATPMRRMNSISHEVGILMLPQLQANKYILRLFGWDWFKDWQNENTNRGVSPAFIMEYATLGPLNRYLSCRSSTSTEKILWCAQTCTALRSARHPTNRPWMNAKSGVVYRLVLTMMEEIGILFVGAQAGVSAGRVAGAGVVEGEVAYLWRQQQQRQ